MNKNWDLVNLGEVLELSIDAVSIEPSKSYSIAGVYSFGRGLFSRSPLWGTETTYKVFHRLHKDSFVLSQLKAWEGALAIVTKSFDGWFLSPQFPTFKAIPNRLDINYLTWYCKQSKVWEQLKNKSRGMGARRDSVSPKKFLSLKIPLPPLEEQRRIVAKVEELAGKIEEARSLREQTIKETQILYNSALSSLINSEGDNWKQSKIADVILDMNAGWSPQCEKYPALKGEWGVLKTTSVQWNKFIPLENKALPQSLKPRPELCVEEKDVLVTRAGPRKRVGVVAAVRKSNSRLMISDKIIRLKPDEKKINPFFLEISLASSFSQKYLFHKKTGLADAQVNISQTILRSTPITYPCLEEQKRIIDYLDRLQAKVDEMKRLREKALQELDALLPSILDRAFKGEL